MALLEEFEASWAFYRRAAVSTCVKAQSSRKPQASTRYEGGPGQGKKKKTGVGVGWSRDAGNPTCSRRRNIRGSLGDKAGVGTQGPANSVLREGLHFSF